MTVNKCSFDMKMLKLSGLNPFGTNLQLTEFLVFLLTKVEDFKGEGD